MKWLSFFLNTRLVRTCKQLYKFTCCRQVKWSDMPEFIAYLKGCYLKMPGSAVRQV